MQNRKRPLALWLVVVILLSSCSAAPVAQTATSTPTTATQPTSAAPTTPAERTALSTPTTDVPSTIQTAPPEATTAVEQPTSTASAATTTPDTTAAPETSVAANSTDVVPPRATSPATATTELATIESLDSITLPRRDAVQLALEFGRTTSNQRVARTEPLPDQVGDVVTFWMSNIDEDTYYTTTARLELALDHVLMYVEEGVPFERQALERSARDFNDRIYPRTRELFGEEWSPGIDGDARITVLNARINGAGGYFSGSDEVPRAVNRFSNEREMFYMNVDDRPLGSDTYSAVLAHEFQHMIQWRRSVRPSTWFNEGFAQLAEELNGYPASDLSRFFLREPDLQLTDWAEEPRIAGAHYGAAYLFLSYFYDRYRDQIDLRQLVQQGAGQHVQLLADDAAEVRPDIQHFDHLYADWAVANLLNDSGLDRGRYSYAELPDTVVPEDDDDGVLSGDVAQYGTDYVEVGEDDQERVLRFDGSDQVGVIADDPDGTMWWSNRGDDAMSTLTHSFDLRSVQSATLQFRAWFDIEEGYDYGFVSASTDGGATWTTLEGEHTTTDDPQGANYGNGYTATSGGDTAQWVDESIDLGAYAGKDVMIRFSLISDDAFNRPGMAIDDIRIPEIGFEDDGENGVGAWQTTGWVRTDNRLDQRWQLRMVMYEGTEPQVQPVTPNADNTADIRIPANTRAVLVLMATTPHTTERASYSISGS